MNSTGDAMAFHLLEASAALANLGALLAGDLPEALCDPLPRVGDPIVGEEAVPELVEEAGASDVLADRQGVLAETAFRVTARSGSRRYLRRPR
jgi:hypothetical protein